MKNKDDLLKTVLNWGLVIRTDLGTIDKIKQFLAELPDVELIYQTVDGGRLWIVREKREGKNDDR